MKLLIIGIAMLKNLKDMTIRPETPDEYPVVYEFIKQAFQSADYREGDEQDFVERRRNTQEYIPELALIAECGGTMTGHVVLTQNKVMQHMSEHPILLLAALSVKQEFRGVGIGTRLVRTAFDKARSLGHKAVILAGDPAYYHRFGFRPAIDYGVTNLNGISAENVLAVELEPNHLQGKAGTFLFPL